MDRLLLICLNSDYYCIAEDRQAFFELVSVEKVPYRVYADNMHITHATSISWRTMVESHQFGTPVPTAGGRNEEALEIAP